MVVAKEAKFGTEVT